MTQRGEGHLLTIEGFPDSFSEQALEQLFLPFGTVIQTSVLRDPSSGKSLRIGTVTMAMREQAERARHALHRTRVDGHVVLVWVH
jgi:RNA recognition motif-containing protein